MSRTARSPRQLTNLPAETSSIQPATSHMASSPPAPPRREHTPSIDTRCPSNPPSIIPAHFSPSKIETPKIGRVVKAGVALQGVLDPTRITPTVSLSQEMGKKRDSLDDLFRGFSEGTRRELQAGLRLGEQLAQQSHMNRDSTLSLSIPYKAPVSAESSDDIFCPQAKHRVSRLLTPEDQADYTLPLPPAHTDQTEVHYPTLMAPEQDSHLVSPARSEDEMSWRVDTPEARAVTAGRSGLVKGANRRNEEVGATNICTVAKKNDDEDYSDIWHEEASRASESFAGEGATSEKIPQLQDILTNDGPIKPARGKLPRTWRRRSSGDFHYSDEAEPETESQQQETPLPTGSDECAPAKREKGKGKTVAPIYEEEGLENEENSFSEASDDTGMFFHTNIKKRVEPREQKNGKVNLSQLLAEGESLLPESSPAAPTIKTPMKPNPFKNTPPRFVAVPTSPVKGSPLRQEVRASDSEEGYRQGFEESSILPPSSPFRTIVEDVSMSTGSDERQIYPELEGQTDSSIRHLRNEADDYFYAYEPQNRTLDEIEEVTERSRTHQSTMLPSSPPRAIEESILVPKRAYAPLFEDVKSTTASSSNTRLPSAPAREQRSTRKPSSAPVIAEAPPVEEAPQSGLFTRLTTSLWGALGSTGPPPLHPLVAKFDHLPKIEPWTKTHYKTLDALYQLHKKQPALFDPSAPPSANNAILTWFQSLHEKRGCKFVGARFSSWGYNVTLTESLVVLCGVYMQLLTRKDIADYEQTSSKKIQMGECALGVPGTLIDGNEVVRRLATVIMGEDLRRDERKGKEIRREGTMTVVWPN